MPTFYTSFVRPILFRLEPEVAHQTMLRACAIGGRSRLLKRLMCSRLRVVDPRLEQTIAGVRFENPLGLAGGLDKNGVGLEMLGSLGFGHIEIGSISAYPSKGNPRPRLFRIPEDEGIVVHYGVPNDGADAVANRISRMSCAVPLGINLVKTNDPSRPPTDEEVRGDYAMAFAKLQSSASFVHLNLSCPNSANDRDYFSQVSKIEALLQRLACEAPRVPVFLKLKPTRDKGFLQELVSVLDRFSFVTGLGMNLPAGKPAELRFRTAREVLEKLPGSVSGRPVESLANTNLRLLYEVIGPGSRYKLIAAGGVFCAEDVYRKIRLGASLVQVYTALVYHGPGIVKQILRGLVFLLERDGFNRVAEAVGVDVI